MRRALAILLAVLLAPGCADDTDIVGSLELGALVRLDLPADETLGSIGMIDGWVLVLTQRRVESPPPEWAPSAIDLYVRWLSPENELGAPIYAGRALGTYRSPRWVREGDSLVGALWDTWDPTETPGDQRRPVRRVAFAPGLEAPTENVTPELPIAVDPRYRLASFAGSYPPLGAEATEPAARSAAGAWLFGHAISDSCSAPFDAGQFRLFALGSGSAVAWGSLDSLCAPPSENDLVGSMWALEVGDEVGVLYRPEYPGTRINWVRLDENLVARAPARVVGTIVPGDPSGFGGQPRGVAMGDAVVFAEREEYRDTCFLLHTMSVDGQAVHPTPWQLPCRTSRVRHRFTNESARATRFLEFAGSDATAVLVFSDAPNPWLEETSPAPVQIHALAITEAGRRGSELVSIAPSEASLAEFVRTAGQAADVAVAYIDSAAGREGAWVRRLRYVPTPR